MTISRAAPDRVEDALSEALGHIRNATQALLGTDDSTTRALLLGLDCLHLQSLFGDLWPTWIPNERTAADSLACAEDALGQVIDHVPLAIWAALRSLRDRVGDGYR